MLYKYFVLNLLMFSLFSESKDLIISPFSSLIIDRGLPNKNRIFGKKSSLGISNLSNSLGSIVSKSNAIRDPKEWPINEILPLKSGKLDIKRSCTRFNSSATVFSIDILCLTVIYIKISKHTSFIKVR
eukprot:NODE_138_length_17968_cov_0.291175.p10 type:complete len:128 gc:universal NODE_138_length_17968_cov_0.291175:10547-10930(+)